MVESYVYRPLSAAHSLRILKIFGDSSPLSTLRCELFEVSLANNPGYEAISYTWGGQTPSQIILCEGKQLLVTKNCETALRKFRPAASNEYRFLWIDSICINQSTDWEVRKERRVQVGMMGQIYGEADQVLVWLGDGGDPAPQHSFARSVLNFTTVFEWLLKISEATAELAEKKHSNNLSQLLGEIDVSHVFVLIPWFKRLWVVQEVALSKKAVLVYGPVRISFKALLRARKVLQELASTNLRVNEVVAALANGFDIHDRASRCLDGVFSTSGPMAAELLAEARFSRTSLARDKVFAMYGLLTALNLDLPAPDYSKSEARIYWETTISIMKSSDNIDLLEQVHGLGGMPALVSWAPDWSSFKHAHVPAQGRQGSHLVSRFSNQISSRAEATIAHDHEGLGQPQDYIQWSQNVQPSDPFWRNVLESQPRQSTAILRVLQTPSRFALEGSTKATGMDGEAVLYATLLSRDWASTSGQRDEGSLRAWHSALLGNAAATPMPADDRHLDVSWMHGTMEHIRNTPQLSQLLDTPEFGIFEAISRSSKLRNQHDRVVACSSYQTLFRTHRGRLGMAPYTTQPGDEIAIFSGGRLPMVVRREGEGNHFRLITPAYVHGIMDGEAWPEDESTRQDFILL
ncbi:hypothetical protein GJ744_004456 [Endocarpon pusillum]|uniref:Heterokaryon incompatibility domain-containing protein n=1 Tax=Endocarpon pusillum TaxID=364733 RepID=A0A8H7AWA2_9EURO|nr:hypothetical protein GJ744_004456 [Endocarpon pusillum]